MKHVTLAMALLLVAWAPAQAEELPAEQRVFVEWQTPQGEVYVGEEFPVRIRLGIDEPYFKAHAVQLFKQALQVPVQITATWPGVVVERTRLDPAGDAEAQRTFVLNGDVVPADRGGVEERDGRRYRILTFQRTVRLEEAGAVALAAPLVRVAFAQQFEEDFLGERVPVEPRFFTVKGVPVRLVVAELPTAGRPALFSGAIGDYVIVAAAPDRTELAAGETLTYSLRLSGFGNLARIDPPALGDLGDWEVRGARAEQTEAGTVVERSFVYELAPKRAGTLTLPALSFAYFRPGSEPGYCTLETQPTAIRVKPRPGEAVPHDPTDAPSSAASERSEPVWLYGVLGAIVGALAVLFVGRKRRAAQGEPESARDPARIEAARAALTAHADEATLSAFLAAHLDCAPAALVSPRLRTRLETAGVPAALAQRTAATLEALVAARYGGSPAGVEPDLVAALQSALTT